MLGEPSPEEVQVKAKERELESIAKADRQQYIAERHGKSKATEDALLEQEASAAAEKAQALWDQAEEYAVHKKGHFSLSWQR